MARCHGVRSRIACRAATLLLNDDGVRRGRTKNNLDTNIRATTYSEGYKRASHIAGGTGKGKCKVGIAISLLRGANGPLPYRA